MSQHRDNQYPFSYSSPLSQQLRPLFPALNQEIRGHPLVYLDNAATTHKPRPVIERERVFYERDNANVHRAPHDLAGRATLAYEAVRDKAKHFLNATSEREIIFTKGTTEGINLIASSYGSLAIQPQDEIVLTELEHHSNIVPWQLLAARIGAKIVVVPVNDKGDLNLEKFRERLSLRTKVVSFTHVSNALGTVNPVSDIVTLVRKHAPQAIIVVDGAQWVAHGPTDVRALGVDFYVCSGHKMFGPTGVGILYGKQEILERMPPFLGGGDMIERVSFQGSTYAGVPARFEAGTPNIAGVIALGAAIDFVSALKWNDIAAEEKQFASEIVTALRTTPGVRLIGEPKERLGVASFVIEGLAPIDAAVIFNQYGIALRAGHHCCMPLMEKLGIAGTLRASWSLYNAPSDAAAFIATLKEVTSKKVKRTLSQLPSPLPVAIDFRPASAPTIAEAAAKIRDLFNTCSDVALKQELLFELGQEQPNILASLRPLTTPVTGCMSEVRLLSKVQDGRIFLASDSNAAIVRGLLSVIEQLYSGQPLTDAQGFNVQEFFESIDINSFLSVQRRSGLSAVISIIENQIRSTPQSVPAACPS